MLRHHLLVLSTIAALCLGGCSPEEEWVDPTGDDDDPSDDDDAVEPIPVTPGSYSGKAWGAVGYSSGANYSCDGSGAMVVDDDMRVTGTVECFFPHTSDTCTLEFEDVELDVGPRDFEFACYGEGLGSIQAWTDTMGFVNGRWQRLGEGISVEINWRAAADPS